MLSKKILILGSQGQLGKEFVEYLELNKYHYHAPQEDEANICDKKSLKKIFESYKPDYVINCAAYNQVDLAEDNSDIAYEVNSYAVKNVAELCKTYNCFMVHYSSDYVFDGNKNTPYNEEDSVSPLNVYGKSKLEGENNVSSVLNEYLVLRLSWVIGKGQQNFLYKLKQWSSGRDELSIVDDEVSVPTFTKTIVEVTIAALEKNLKGLYHLCSNGFCSRYDLAKRFFEIEGIDIKLRKAKLSDFNTNALRPGFSAMSSSLLQEKLGFVIGQWDEILKEFVKGN